MSFTTSLSIRVAGAGRGITVLLPEVTGSHAVTITPGASGHVGVSDMTIRGYYTSLGTDKYLLSISTAAVATLTNVHVQNETTGGGLKLDTIPSVYIDGLGGRATKNGSFLKVNNCGGTIANAQGIVAPQATMSDSRPCVYLTTLNSLNFSNCEFGGFGPRSTYTITGITSGASTFTVTCGTHNFVADDWIAIRGASVSTYNNTWTIASVTATTFTVNSTANPGAASGGTAEHLAACVHVSNESGAVNEWQFTGCLFYDAGSAQTYGRADVFLDGARDGGIAYNITGGQLIGNYYDGADYGIVVNSGASATVAGVSIAGGTHSNKTCQLLVIAGVTGLTYTDVTPSGGTPGDDGAGGSAAVRIYGGTTSYKPTGIVLRGQLGQSRFQNTGTFAAYKYGVVIDDAAALSPPNDITITGSQIFGSTQPILFTGGGSTLNLRRYNISGNTYNSGTNPQTTTGWLPSIASAGNINLTSAAAPHEIIKITGTVTISTINGTWTGRTLTLLFVSALTLGTGGNFAIGANRTVLAGDCITMVFDGTSWYIR